MYWSQGGLRKVPGNAEAMRWTRGRRAFARTPRMNVKTSQVTKSGPAVMIPARMWLFMSRVVSENKRFNTDSRRSGYGFTLIGRMRGRWQWLFAGRESRRGGLPP